MTIKKNLTFLNPLSPIFKEFVDFFQGKTEYCNKFPEFLALTSFFDESGGSKDFLKQFIVAPRFKPFVLGSLPKTFPP